MSLFSNAVADAAADTPYSVVVTKKGFDLQLDLGDRRWWGLLEQVGLSSTFRWKVVEKPGFFTITDQLVRVRWHAGIPGFGFSWNIQRGRIASFTRVNIWAAPPGGRIEPVAAYRFNSREGRDLIRLVAKQLGLRERPPLSVTAAVGVALLAPAFWAAYGLVELVMRLIS